MNRYIATALLALLSATAQADRIRPDVEVNVPPEVFSSGGAACAAL
ncbi:protein YnjH [Enterobacter cancerogenus]|uniref:Protein YnjH n=1 Tax=Enterobacter cancerogenus TaxID=69218 RepID=A0A484Z6B6_9ENTR|nr:protein YnjH [Enterobacter cancerogenus]